MHIISITSWMLTNDGNLKRVAELRGQTVLLSGKRKRANSRRTCEKRILLLTFSPQQGRPPLLGRTDAKNRSAFVFCSCHCGKNFAVDAAKVLRTVFPKCHDSKGQKLYVKQVLSVNRFKCVFRVISGDVLQQASGDDSVTSNVFSLSFNDLLLDTAGSN